ncbi:hypothetical protein DSS3PM1_00005 [Bacteriophage DSS3_PM1]|nr:hypothetical protein DSS3PM1_00005 [Bacteriophage DSS3_PM1]
MSYTPKDYAEFLKTAYRNNKDDMVAHLEKEDIKTHYPEDFLEETRKIVTPDRVTIGDVKAGASISVAKPKSKKLK